MSYIVPREKPKKCWNCEFLDRVDHNCKLMRDKDYEYFATQYANCPLVEVSTPHGDLIDRDAPHLKNALKGIREVETQIYGRASWGFANKSISVIYDAPTIIEAEGSEE